MTVYTDPTKRHDFILLFDVTDGNPNGDPDAGNLPRVDPETMQGLVTDVCLKRKVRNYVQVAYDNQARYDIFVKHATNLNRFIALAHEETGGLPKGKANKKKVEEAREKMCEKYYDVRAFGAVMSTGANAGQVRGPIQLGFARSIDPVLPLDLSITRMAVADEAKGAKSAEDYARWEAEQPEDELRTMGRKALIPYGLYRGYGFFNPALAQQTGFDEADLDLFWNALQNMWDHDHSAARGLMALRGMYVFTHDNGLGNAPAHILFDRLKVDLKESVPAPRSVGDYVIECDDSELPSGVTLTQLV